MPCVSNFSHFLDMCRKTLRLLELGVPVVVLSRSHTSQYPYRWVMALSSELQAAGVDPSYLTFCSAGLPEQQALIRAAAGALRADPRCAADGISQPASELPPSIEIGIFDPADPPFFAPAAPPFPERPRPYHAWRMRVLSPCLRGCAAGVGSAGEVGSPAPPFAEDSSAPGPSSSCSIVMFDHDGPGRPAM